VDYFARDTHYGEWGAPLLVCAPSSGFRGSVEVQHIATAQPYGRSLGFASDEQCSHSFGGTSASAPLVAGVVALMLQSRPALSWRDVQHVLALSAVRNDQAHSTWAQNGAGHWVSHAYGFGVVNASAAVSLARRWPLLSASDYRSVSAVTAADTDLDIAEHPLGAPLTVELTIDDSDALVVEFVELYLTVEHPRRGDLEIMLYSPVGTRSELALPHDDKNAHYDHWRFGTRLVLGESAAGRWRLTLNDMMPNQRTGRLLEAELRVWGH
jgi:kexin